MKHSRFHQRLRNSRHGCDKIVRIESWLPVFSGFYNTCWDVQTDDISEELRVQGFGCEFDWVKYWDNAGYEDDTVKAVVRIIQRWLPPESGIQGVEFEKVCHPREYNFGNDSVNVAYAVNLKKFSRWFRKFLRGQKKEWEVYLRRRYTSRDGFISYYPNDPGTWAAWTKNYSCFDLPEGASFWGRGFPEHAFGSLLTFWFETQTERLSPGYDDVELSLWEMVRESVYPGSYLNLPQGKEAA